MQEVRQRARKFQRHAHHRPQHPGVQHRRRQLRHRLRHPRAGAHRRWRPSASSRVSAPSRWAACVDAHHDAPARPPELRVQVDRERAADLGSTSSRSPPPSALMVGGDEEVSRFRDPFVDQDYDVQLRLSEHDRSDPGHDLASCTSRAPGERPRLALGAAAQVGLAPGGGLVRLDNVVEHRAGRRRVPHRPVGAPAREPAPAASSRPATARPTGWKRSSTRPAR